MSSYVRRCRVLEQEIRIHLYDTGDGIHILIEGGEKAHIGAVAAAAPGFPVQVITFPGHKEDVVCRLWANRICQVYQGPVAVEAGIHYDGIGKEEIQQILGALEKELEDIIHLIESGGWKNDREHFNYK